MAYILGAGGRSAFCFNPSVKSIGAVRHQILFALIVTDGIVSRGQGGHCRSEVELVYAEVDWGGGLMGEATKTTALYTPIAE